MLTRNELVCYKATLSEWRPPDEFIRSVGELEEKVRPLQLFTDPIAALWLHDVQHLVVAHGWRGGQAVGGGLGCAACNSTVCEIERAADEARQEEAPARGEPGLGLLE